MGHLPPPEAHGGGRPRNRRFKGCGTGVGAEEAPGRSYKWASKGGRRGAPVEERKGVLRARILASVGCGGQRTWLERAGPDSLESLGAVAGGTGADRRQESKAGQRLGSLAGLGRGRKLAREGPKRERCRRPQSELGAGRKEAPRQKALPGFQPG